MPGLDCVIVIFAVSMGGLFAGWFTPTEAGGIGAAAVLVLTVLERKLKFDGILNDSSHDGGGCCFWEIYVIKQIAF